MLLKGHTVYVRALEPGDLDVFYEVENDTSLWQCTDVNVPYSRAVLARYLSSTTDDIYADRQVRLVACLAAGDEPVAFVDLTDFSPRHLRAQVGIVVFPPYRRRGIAAQVLALVAEYARVQIGISLLYAVVAESNMPSQALFAKAGYQRTATLHRWLAVDGCRDDAAVFEKILCPQPRGNNH